MEHSAEAAAGLARVAIPLDGSQGYGFETVWAEPIAGGHYRLRNVPFLAYGYSEQDVVVAAEVEGRLEVISVVGRGGHSTYRIFLTEPGSDEQFAHMWQPLAMLGCTYERANRRVIGIDVPPGSDVYQVYAALQEGETDMYWEFEEGHCGHPLRGANGEYGISAPD